MAKPKSKPALHTASHAETSLVCDELGAILRAVDADVLSEDDNMALCAAALRVHGELSRLIEAELLA